MDTCSPDFKKALARLFAHLADPIVPANPAKPATGLVVGLPVGSTHTAMKSILLEFSISSKFWSSYQIGLVIGFVILTTLHFFPGTR